MRIIFSTVVIVSLTMVSCKKSSEGNKNVLVKETSETSYSDINGKTDSTASFSYQRTENGKTNREETVVYTGLDNAKAKVTFIDTPNEHTLTIEANKRKFQLDKKESNPLKTTYERNGIKAEEKGDSLYIIQGDNIIPLKRSRG